jgi:hypothetical protein
MKKRVLASVLLGAAFHVLAGCGGGDSDRQVDRMIRPLYVGVDPLGRKLTYILDAARTSVFLWDGDNETYNTGRAPGPNNPNNYIAIPVGTNSELRRQDVLFTGFAVNATGGALAALYSFGFDDRVGHLTIVPMAPFPVDPEANLNYTLPPGAVGPFATPEGQFLLTFPRDTSEAEWRSFPAPSTPFTGPNVARMVWNARGTRLYAADRVNQQVHVFDWPAMTPVTSISLPHRPIDLALRDDTEQLAVITTASLYLYGSLPTLAVEQSVRQIGLPVRVLFDRHESGQVLAVLNQNTTLSFYESDTLCQVDIDSVGFTAASLRFVDAGELSNPTIEGLATSGCASFVPDQVWQLTFEGLVAEGSGAVSSPTAITFTTADRDLQIGDPLLVGGFPSEITAIGTDVLYFEPITQALSFGEAVTIEVRAGDAWTVVGNSTGYVGRAQTGEQFRGVITFQIVDQGAAPTRGDQFLFQGQSNVSPIFLSGAPSDVAQDPYGRFIATIPENGHARAVDVKMDEAQWVIQTLYIIQ